ncbi:hypothetical protein GF312_09885 [Candidatus Poribacteria bacterium]|nr:hypothetical protein [Candidatus Poribacteria bacterium]
MKKNFVYVLKWTYLFSIFGALSTYSICINLGKIINNCGICITHILILPLQGERDSKPVKAMVLILPAWKVEAGMRVTATGIYLILPGSVFYKDKKLLYAVIPAIAGMTGPNFKYIHKKNSEY